MSCLPFHQICLEALPAGDFKSLSAGLICGAPLPVEETTAQLRGMGMAHIIVVSGAHLLWLEHGYRKLTPSTFHFLIGPLLLIYCGVSLFQPPAVRSLFHWTASTVSERYGLNWSLENRLTISLLLSLMFQPAWSTSLSLMLSWLAGLGVCLGQQAFPKIAAVSAGSDLVCLAASPGALWRNYSPSACKQHPYHSRGSRDPFPVGSPGTCISTGSNGSRSDLVRSVRYRRLAVPA